jgi:signal transduction histidine kinase
VVTVAIAPGLPAAACDRDRVVQVLSNLVGNASKVTAAGGHIVLGVELCGADLLFVVSDDGPGISEEDVKHLFERYWRSGQAEYRGTGLGLAISRGIVDAHGGQLWVETKLGHGAAFYFTIPCATAAGA